MAMRASQVGCLEAEAGQGGCRGAAHVQPAVHPPTQHHDLPPPPPRPVLQSWCSRAPRRRQPPGRPTHGRRAWGSSPPSSPPPRAGRYVECVGTCVCARSPPVVPPRVHRPRPPPPPPMRAPPTLCAERAGGDPGRRSQAVAGGGVAGGRGGGAAHHAAGEGLVAARQADEGARGVVGYGGLACGLWRWPSRPSHPPTHPPALALCPAPPRTASRASMAAAWTWCCARTCAALCA